MNCIKIVNDLAGGDRPDWILKAWIGLILPIQLEFSLFSRGQLDLSKIGLIPDDAVFPVDMQTAVAILSLHQPRAAEWWIENIPVRGKFCFSSQCSELIEGVPSITKKKDAPTQVTVAEFLTAVSTVDDSSFTPSPQTLGRLFLGGHLTEVLQSALTSAAVVLIANEVVRTCRFVVESASSEDHLDRVLKEGHGTLQVMHLIAEQSGVRLPREWVNRPLSIVEELECDGFVEVVDREVRLVPNEQLPLNLTRQ